MDWARENIKREHLVTFASSKNADEGVVQDIYLMVLCRHHVTSNSSLHWWAARLARKAEDSIVVSPDAGWPFRDGLLDEWVKIPI